MDLQKQGSISSGMAKHVAASVDQARQSEIAYLKTLLLPDQLKPILLHFEYTQKELEKQLSQGIDDAPDVIVTDEMKRSKAISAAQELVNDANKLLQVLEYLRSPNMSLNVKGLEAVNALLSISDVYVTPLDRLQVSETFVKVYETVRQIPDLLPLVFRFASSPNVEIQKLALKIIQKYAPGPRIALTPTESPLHPSQMTFKRLIISVGGVTVLCELLKITKDSDVIVECLKCLVEIAKNNVEARDFLISADLMNETFFNLMSPDTDLKVLSVSTSLFSLLASSYKLAQHASMVLTIIEKLVEKVTDSTVLVNLMKCLYSSGSSSLIVAMPPPSLYKVIKLLNESSSPVVQEAVMRVIDAVVMSGAHQHQQQLIQVIIDDSVLPTVVKMLSSPKIMKSKKILEKLLETIGLLCQLPAALPALLKLNILPVIGEMVTSTYSNPTDKAVIAISISTKLKAVEILKHVSRSSAKTSSPLYTTPFITHILNLLDLWQVYPSNEKPPVYNLTLCRDILEILWNILHPSDYVAVAPDKSRSPFPFTAMLFTTQHVDTLTAHLLKISASSEPEIMLYKHEFVGKISIILKQLHLAHTTTTAISDVTKVKVHRRLVHVIELVNDTESAFSSTPTPSTMPQSSSTSSILSLSSTDSRVSIKCYFHNDNRLFDVVRSVSLADLKAHIAQLYGVRAGVTIQYRDYEGDLITIGSQPALEKALQRTEKTLQNQMFGSTSTTATPTLTLPVLKLLVREGEVYGTTATTTTPSIVPLSGGNSEYTQLQQLLIQQQQQQASSSSTQSRSMAPSIAQLFDFWSQRASVSGQNSISKADLVAGFSSYLGIKDEVIMEQAYKAFDVDGDGKLDIREIVMGMSALQNGSLDERLLLRVYDSDRSGYISKDEIRSIFLSEMRRQGGQRSVDEEMLDSVVDHLFELVDLNKDGQLSLHEFKSGVLNGNITGCFGL